jgi:CubicO group peptidase (beta-lactamase class C family)
MKPFLTAFITLALSFLAAAAAPSSLNPLLNQLLATNQLPALGAVVVRSNAVIAIGAAGLRRADGPERVTVNDKWHIGSCTKSMTATLAAMLIEDGKFRWDTSLAEAFPQLAPKFQPGWSGVTLLQLLAHRGGAPHTLDADGLWGRLWKRAAQPPLEQRTYAVGELLTKHAPIHAAGGKFEYSNAGYMLVGHALELRLGSPWETLLRERVFTPLGMTNSGFGMPAALGQADQPWGHTRRNGKLVPVKPGLSADNPAAIGPGGTVHCSLEDFAKYAAFHLRGHRAGDSLLPREGFRKLHTRFAADGDYALGWSVLKRGWGGGDVLTHNGSNTMNFAVMWLAPERDFAVVVCTNYGGDDAARLVDQVVGKLIQQFLISSGGVR